MSEWWIGVLSTLKILLVAVFSLCYWAGGRKWKFIRRILGSIVFGGGVILFSLAQGCFSRWLFVYPIALFVALSMGYGGDTLLEKCRRRAIYGLVLGLSCAPVAILNQAWVLWGIQIGLALFASIVFGVLNPFSSAVDEENLIACFSVILVSFMLKLGGG